jgi:hypothetical protein
MGSINLIMSQLHYFIIFLSSFSSLSLVIYYFRLPVFTDSIITSLLWSLLCIKVLTDSVRHLFLTSPQTYLVTNHIIVANTKKKVSYTPSSPPLHSSVSNEELLCAGRRESADSE